MKDPFFAGQFSPFGTLALFSKHFARPQPDWPANVTQTGFVFYDRRGPGFGEEEVSAARGLAPELDAFLKAGSPPVVFTLGSSAVMHPGEFYRESLAAAERLGSRAVLLVGPAEREALGRTNSDLVHIAEYAPYSELMPRAAATVHQGGIGTTAQALRSGRPMLVVPWSHDQPDNAERIRKLGVGRVLARKRYTAKAAAAELSHLLQERTYRERAAQMGAAVSGEDGLSAACDEIEAVLERISAPHANTRLDS
jgi:UDP:flavonoid glycosyltransferase YjiC (YdhE family)